MFNNLSFTEIAVVIISILISMGLHEAVHAFVSHWLGDTTAKDEGRLTLNPLKHVDLYTTILLPLIMILIHVPPIFVAKPVPFNSSRVRYDEFGVAMIGVSGPLTNLGLAIIGAIIFRIFGPNSINLSNYLILFVDINILFFIFNMIPIPPLDGSRLLYAFAPEPLQDIMRKIESFGFISILLVFILLIQVLWPVISFLEISLNNLLLG
ncbi:MAG: site-2 protease family protein [Candidatus Saccharibacteria bacterium]